MSTASETAANYGYSVAFFNSDPELKSLLNKAVSGNWTPAQFVAKLQATKWFRTHGEAARQLYALKTSDPATWNQRVRTARDQVLTLARQLGAGLSSANIKQIAEQALGLGWSDDQIKNALNKFITVQKDGTFRGNAATVQQQILQLSQDYGYDPQTKTMGEWVRGIMSGAMSVDQVKNALINHAASKYPPLKDRLLAGETLDQIAAPYKDSYSKILEVNPQTISIDDPMLQKALSTKDAKGRPTTQTIWQFESDLKKDRRWLSTNNARDQLVGNTHKLLQDFGLTV